MTIIKKRKRKSITERHIYRNVIVFLIFAVSLSCSNNNVNNLAPPIIDTHIKMDMEEGKNRSLKHSWFDLIHGSKDNLDWRKIERERAYSKYKSRINNQAIQLRNGQTTIADGDIIGEWSERGSSNLAGSILKTAYDEETNLIYAIAAGGSLWTGTEEGDWTLANHDLRFDGNLLSLGKLPDGSKRLALTIGGIPHYADLAGLEVNRSNGFFSGEANNIIDVSSINEGKEIFILTQRNSTFPIEMYFSNDYGLNFEKLKEFEETDPDKIAMVDTDDESNLFIIEVNTDTKSKLFKWDRNIDKFALTLSSMDIGFGPDGTANITSTKSGSNYLLFVYDVYGNFYRSDDQGLNWNYIAKLPASPWDAGIVISKMNPNLMMLAEVDCFRTLDGGQSWSRINYWWEYYIDDVYKLHADIMDIREFRRNDGSLFTLISNHGGISITEDFGLNNTNISLNGLNVSQYYDAKTYEHNTSWIFGASQDQGFQMTQDLSESTLSFDQIRSGDYSNISFTGDNKEHVWVVYPLGEVNYYEDPISGQLPLRFNALNKIHPSIWIPPIFVKDETDNSVYLAGGNIDGGSGSHIIKLTPNSSGTEIIAQQLPFDFTLSGGEISALEFDPFNDNKWYVSTTNGKFYISENNGQSFQLKSYGIPGSDFLYASKILCSNSIPGKLFVCGAGYSNPAVLQSNDGGESFKALSNKLPKTAGLDMALSEDDDFLYLATEAGPLVYIFAKESWFEMGGGFAPNSSYWSVDYLPNSKKIRFGTYGRGIWDFDILSTTSSNEVELTPMVFDLYPNPVSSDLRINFKLASTQSASFQIFNSQGKEIEKSALKAFENIVDCSRLQQGLYFVVVKAFDQQFSKSFIKI